MHRVVFGYLAFALRRLFMWGEVKPTRPVAPITRELLLQVKAHMLAHQIPSRLADLIQLNTGMRIPQLALHRLDDLVLDHDIPHL